MTAPLPHSTLDGVLVVDKPEGPTSHDMVARVRRLLDTPRVGHTGTLDPMATGVLPLVLGRATRLARFLTAGEKRYEAVVRLGQETDTYDRLGSPVGPAAPVLVTSSEIEDVLERFRGTFIQTPPPYSAKKIGGVSAHRLARRGEAVTPAAVPVTVHELTMTARREDLITLEVTCSAGFYVRSLAHDVGQGLGCGGHLAGLRRTASGDWTDRDAILLEQLQHDPDAVRARIVPMARLLPRVPAVHVSDEGVTRVRHGQPLRLSDLTTGAPPPDEPFLRVLGPDQALLALAEPTAAGLLHPSLVLV